MSGRAAATVAAVQYTSTSCLPSQTFSKATSAHLCGKLALMKWKKRAAQASCGAEAPPPPVMLPPSM